MLCASFMVLKGETSALYSQAKTPVNIEAATEGDWRMSVALKFSDGGKDYEIRRHREESPCFST